MVQAWPGLLGASVRPVEAPCLPRAPPWRPTSHLGGNLAGQTLCGQPASPGTACTCPAGPADQLRSLLTLGTLMSGAGPEPHGFPLCL